MSVKNVENAQMSTRLLAATTLRNILGTKTLQEILQDREHIAHSMQVSFDGLLVRDVSNLFCLFQVTFG
jgi:erythrocyte band 7 integral membrane protein